MTQATRNIIVHYHIFKNAGSSVDQLLRKNFGSNWTAFDGETPGSIISSDELAKTIESQPQTVAFSSHQIVPPLPRVDANVYPIVFLRDPIDRIKSAYLFEWKKQLGLEEPKGTFEEFVKLKFTYKRKSSIEEFQTIRLSNVSVDTFDSEAVSDDEMLERACNFISGLSFVGIVDDFDRSNALLESYLGAAFPDFRVSDVQANVLQDITLAQSVKRQRIREELGDELFETIVDRNRLDEGLYQAGRSHFETLFQALESDERKLSA